MDVPYTALARRFRPQTFAEVVGQERIAQTLRNAIRDGRVAHAYLFTGARGVGKTSMARIFAKALNCPHAIDAVPCNECEICKGIAAGQDVDVSEIDGASNRGIDDIRQLRANVGVRSMRTAYKIYIVDEVHMLTKEAFNALLKTLEEPPPGVKFIFCTTEPNKVPDTILSRCQRFDFGTVATASIIERLRQIAETEGFAVEPAALALVARRAAGSMRDSQSLFDQLLAFGTRSIAAADVHRLLGTAPDERLTDLMQALVERRRADALGTFQQALDDGVQLEPFFDQLVAYVRDAMVLAAGADQLELSSVGDELREQVAAQGKAWGLQTCVAALEVLAETKLKMQRSTFGRALCELALVRLSLLKDLDRLDDLIAHLKAGGTATAPSGTRPVAAAAPTAGPIRNSLPEKKTAEFRSVASNAPAIESAPGIPPEEVAPTGDADAADELPHPPAIAWSPQAGPAILAALRERFRDIVGSSLQQASTAISGPNQLDFLFHPGYDLGRKACQRPEVVSRIESTIRDLTGQSIRVRIGVATEATPPPAPVAAPAAPVSRRVAVDNPDDPLVQEVSKTFGIETWLKQEFTAVATVAADETPPPDE
jgi:DNA polymerase-3 subunit gamma/tau